MTKLGRLTIAYSSLLLIATAYAPRAFAEPPPGNPPTWIAKKGYLSAEEVRSSVFFTGVIRGTQKPILIADRGGENISFFDPGTRLPIELRKWDADWDEPHWEDAHYFIDLDNGTILQLDWDAYEDERTSYSFNRKSFPKVHLGDYIPDYTDVSWTLWPGPKLDASYHAYVDYFQTQLDTGEIELQQLLNTKLIPARVSSGPKLGTIVLLVVDHGLGIKRILSADKLYDLPGKSFISVGTRCGDRLTRNRTPRLTQFALLSDGSSISVDTAKLP